MMPDVGRFSTEDAWMEACVPARRDEGMEQDQAVASCLNQWRERDKASASAEKPQAAERMEAEVLDLVTHRHSGATGYNFKAARRDAEVLIYGEIGDELFGGVSAKAFATDLKKAGKLDNITVRLNSPGGSIFDGVAIYNTLRNHPAKVGVHIDGLAASAASVVAMAGDTIEMADNALLMIHEPWYLAAGSASELRAIAVSLDKISEGMADTYAKRAGKSIDEARAWMEAETWFTAEDARAAGLVDKLVEPLKAAAAASWDATAWRKRFRHPPDAMLAEAPPAGTPLSAYAHRFRDADMVVQRLKAAKPA
jgi:ATP-dependent Clp protease, protease subunit